MNRGATGRDVSILSAIPELVFVNGVVYLVLIGPNAWKLTEALCRGISKEGVSSPSKRKAPTFLSDRAPMSCTLPSKEITEPGGSGVASAATFVEEVERSQPLSVESETQGFFTQQDAPEAESSQASAPGIIRALSRGMANLPRSLTQKSLASRHHHSSRSRLVASVASSAAAQALKLLCFPVEKFSESVPVCQSVDQWRALCMVYLVDSRADARYLQDLSSRLVEVRVWVKQFIQASDVSCAPAHLQVVLQHAQTNSGMQSKSSSSEEELAFVEKVKNLGQAPATEDIQYPCDFDDVDSFAACIRQVLGKLWECRKGEDYEFNPEFLDTLEKRHNSDHTEKNSCFCTVM